MPCVDSIQNTWADENKKNTYKDGITCTSVKAPSESRCFYSISAWKELAKALIPRLPSVSMMFVWLVTDSKDCVMSPDAFESDRPTDLEGDSHIKKTELLTEILKRTLRGTKIL